MEIKGYKIIIIITALLVTLGVFFFAEHYFFEYRVEKPLIEAISDLSEVEEVVISEQRDMMVVQIELGWVDNIKRSHKKIEEIIIDYTDNENFIIEINDNRNNDLEIAYNNMHYGLYEALITSEFTMLKEYVENQISSEEDNIEYSLFVDKERIYLQLKKGDHYLYKILK